MIARLILKYKSPVGRRLDDICERYPLLSSILIQVSAAVFLIGAVALIAFVGGSLVWLFYKAFGIM